MIYKFREGYSLPVPAQIVGERITLLEDRLKGSIGCGDVVEDARPEDSPLHPCFEWDDTAAAEKWRHEQARRLLRSIETVTISGNGKETRVPTLVSVGEKVSAYRFTPKAMADDTQRQIVISDAKAQLAGWVRRYGHLVAIAKEFGPVVSAIDHILNTLSEATHDEAHDERPTSRTRRPSPGSGTARKEDHPRRIRHPLGRTQIGGR